MSGNAATQFTGSKDLSGTDGLSIFFNAVLPSQFYEQNHSRNGQYEGERRLMNALLEGALREFIDYIGDSNAEARRLFAEANTWIFEKKATAYFSFDLACESLDIEPEYLRGGIRKWAAAKRIGAHVPSLKRRSPVVAGNCHKMADNDYNRVRARVRRAADPQSMLAFYEDKRREFQAKIDGIDRSIEQMLDKVNAPGRTPSCVRYPAGL
jgi:hypothetical protein